MGRYQHAAIMGLLAVLALIGSLPASAAEKLSLVGTITVGGEADGYFIEYDNPEGNFAKLCQKGRNQSMPWMRQGAKFPLLDGNEERIGRVRVVDASWEPRFSGNARKGRCIYEIRATGVPRSNYYCIRLPNGWVKEISNRRAINKNKQRLGATAYLYPSSFSERQAEYYQYSDCAK